MVYDETRASRARVLARAKVAAKIRAFHTCHRHDSAPLLFGKLSLWAGEEFQSESGQHRRGRTGVCVCMCAAYARARLVLCT